MRTALSRAAILVALACAVPPGARAEDERFGAGVPHVGLSGGWAHGFEPQPSQAQDEVRMLAFVPHLGVGLSDELAEGAWYAGNFDLSLEPQTFWQLRGEDGWATGAALYLRYQFLAAEPVVVPFIGFGGGALALDVDGRHQDDGFNFIVQLGAGAHVPIGDRTAITLDARWHHISNAGLRRPNRGIDSALGLVGLTWFLP